MSTHNRILKRFRKDQVTTCKVINSHSQEGILPGSVSLRKHLWLPDFILKKMQIFFLFLGLNRRFGFTNFPRVKFDFALPYLIFSQNFFNLPSWKNKFISIQYPKAYRKKAANCDTKNVVFRSVQQIPSNLTQADNPLFQFRFYQNLLISTKFDASGKSSMEMLQNRPAFKANSEQILIPSLNRAVRPSAPWIPALKQFRNSVQKLNAKSYLVNRLASVERGDSTGHSFLSTNFRSEKNFEHGINQTHVISDLPYVGNNEDQTTNNRTYQNGWEAKPKISFAYSVKPEPPSDNFITSYKSALKYQLPEKLKVNEKMNLIYSRAHAIANGGSRQESNLKSETAKSMSFSSSPTEGEQNFLAQQNSHPIRLSKPAGIAELNASSSNLMNSVNDIAEGVFDLFEKRMRIERERRGIFF